MVSDPARLLGWKRGVLELLDWSTCGHGLCEIKIQHGRYDRVVLVVYVFFFFFFFFFWRRCETLTIT
jgi:hypothetical protein